MLLPSPFLPSSWHAAAREPEPKPQTSEQTPRQKKIVWAVGERGRATDIIRLGREGLAGMVELSPQIPNRIERRPIRTARHHETKSNALNMEHDTTILGRRCFSVKLAMAEEKVP